MRKISVIDQRPKNYQLFFSVNAPSVACTSPAGTFLFSSLPFLTPRRPALFYRSAVPAPRFEQIKKKTRKGTEVSLSHFHLDLNDQGPLSRREHAAEKSATA